MFATETLLRQARALLRNHHPIPLDLFAALAGAGIDVHELERTTAQ